MASLNELYLLGARIQPILPEREVFYENSQFLTFTAEKGHGRWRSESE
jgi:hypothetical protein